MDALRKKWNSSRGASILLALLFLLVCMMVGASVLMAAASNAGKLRSNQVEQQRYLTLSSALTMLCGELEKVEYRGKYEHSCTATLVELKDGEGNVVESYTHYDHTYTQTAGSIQPAGGAGEWNLKDVVPIVNDMDLMFAERFKAPASNDNEHKYQVTRLEAGEVGKTAPHALEIAANADETYGGLSEPVSVTVSMRRGVITVYAALKDHRDYAMEATLEPVEGKEPDKALVVEKRGDTAVAREECETKPVAWKLDRILKKEGTP